MMEIEKELQFLKYVIENLIENKKSITIKRQVDEKGVLLLLTVAKEEMGKIIGKNGRVIQAIRTLLKMIGAKSQERITLKIVEPEEK